MGALVLLQTAQALFIAAHTAVDGLHLPGSSLAGPSRVGQQLAAHGGAGDAAAGQLGFHKIRIGQAAHAGDRFVGILAHLIAELQEATLPLKIGMIGGRDSILQAGMVGQGNVEAGHTGLHQQRYKDTQFAFQYTGIAVVGVLLPDSQFVVDGQLRQAAADGLDSLDRKTGTVFSTATVFIGALVECRGEELSTSSFDFDNITILQCSSFLTL